MADRLCDEILAGTYADDDRVPSVREYAVALEVNTNTLARDGVIYNRRGLGYFVTPGARATIMEQRRRAFLGDTLPAMLRQMRLLGIGIDEVVSAWNSTATGA